jgi:hypothetical protein
MQTQQVQSSKTVTMAVIEKTSLKASKKPLSPEVHRSKSVTIVDQSVRLVEEVKKKIYAKEVHPTNKMSDSVESELFNKSSNKL